MTTLTGAPFGFVSCDDAEVTSAPAAILVVAGPCGAGKTSAARHVAAALERSAHLQADHFTAFVVNDLADTEARHEVVGGAIGAAAIQFAVGGYTVVLDGTFFPGGVAGLAVWAARRGVGVHYAVLRPDLETCRERAQRRSATDPDDLEAFDRLHARFADLGNGEGHVVDHTGAPEVVAAAVLAVFASGALLVE